MSSQPVFIGQESWGGIRDVRPMPGPSLAPSPSVSASGELCRWCGRGELTPAMDLSANNELGREFSLATCQVCGAWQVDPPLKRNVVQDYFAEPARWDEGRDPEGRPVDPVERAESRMGEYANYASAISAQIAGGRVLDVGAGTGLMLSLLPDTFQKIAVEPNPKAADLASRRGLTVKMAWAEDLELPNYHIDVLIMNQVLDHLIDPGRFLSRAQNWIKPGGYLLISGLINPEGLMARVFGPRFRLWDPLYQFYPTPTSFSMVLGVWGIEAQQWWQPYFYTPYGGPLKMLKAAPEVLAAMMGRRTRGLSPAWPGNTFSVLARKTMVRQSLEEAQKEAIKVPSLSLVGGDRPY